VIVDYSPTVSDVGGLMYLLAHPDVEVIAISLPVTGEAGCDLGVRVTLGILSKMGQEHVPVACDPEVPTESETWPDEFLEGATSLLSGIPKLSPEENGQTGTDLIVEAAMTSDRPVTIYAVAPLTNVARALRREPGIADNITQIVIMGGAVDVAGNVFDSPAEWNIFIDAGAAADVISSGVPITLVALDATNDVPVPGWYPIALGRAEQSDQIVYLSRLVDSSPAVMSGFFYLWDELAAAVAAHAVEFTSEEATLSVVVGGPDSGQTARDPEGTQVAVATGVVSPEEFYAEFIGRLAGAAFEKGEATDEEEAYLIVVALSLEELGVALEETFASGSIFDADEYDGDAVAEAIEVIFSAFGTSLESVERLEPPESLSEIHAAYIEELRTDQGQQEVLIPGLRAATTWEEAFVLFELLGDGAACEAVANEAFFLGVDAEFPCNP
jgi:inosine-uridine nucleoside N-ribohydrolase